MAQIIQTTGLLRATLRQPFFAAQPAFPSFRGKAKNFDLHLTAFQRARQNIGANRGNRNRAAAHGSGIIQQQSHAGVAKFGVLFDFERQGRSRVCHNPREAARIQNALFLVKRPASVLLCLKAALQFVCQPRHGALQGFQLLIKIGAQAFQFGRFSQIFGTDFFVVIGGIDDIIRVRVRNRLRRRRFHRGLALGHVGFFRHLGVGAVIHRHLRFGGVLLVFLALFGRAFGFVFFTVVLAG